MEDGRWHMQGTDGERSQESLTPHRIVDEVTRQPPISIGGNGVPTASGNRFNGFRRSAWLAAAILLTSLAAALAQPRNVVFILSDDHRYDFMGFHENAPDFLETPSLDRMAAEGVHLKNAFVTTSLCSPSRASIFTGQYAHNHRVVDNTSPIPPDVRFFPVDLQEAGYETALVGKWHMGENTDDPKPGFDRWVSFRGQGVYYNPMLNVDGERKRYEGYTSDLLTDFAIKWLEGRDTSSEKPFFLFLSHKAVHAEFEPAERHAGRYGDVKIPYPASMADTESNYRGKPQWVKEQRYGWHGVDYAYHGQMEFDTFYKRYAETLLGVDESVGRVLDFLDEQGLAEQTLVFYMGDNGFMLGEHGLIDKRQAYEESIRVPMLAYAPGFIEPGSTTESLIRNIDIAPTILTLAGVDVPERMDGSSFLPVLAGEDSGEGREFLYEYYWEYAFPHTPTVFALRGDRYKYIFYHGVWDLQELYDLQADPKEQFNLIHLPDHRERVTQMRSRLFDLLEETGGMTIPLKRATNWQAGERKLR
ncbi:MAG TPA: sulfatase [Rhodothermales bacterium]|nr:sulfatase [Rhodothermales bacterium]